MSKRAIATLMIIITSLHASLRGENLVISSDSVDVASSLLLDNLVVTATRTPKTLKDVPVVTTLIPASEIKKSDATTIRDLLTDEMPGLEFGFAMSQETALSMNGMGGNTLLFLVDGERLAGETVDNVDYDRLSMDNVGHIEIVKGASSALYGANAVGGVINIISQECKEPWEASFDTRWRSMGNECRTGANVGFKQGKWTSNTSARFVRSNTVQLADPFDGGSMVHQMYGGNNLNVKERLIFSPRDDLRLIARGGYFRRLSQRNNFDDHYTDYNAGLKGEWHKGSLDFLELSYSFDQYNKSRYVFGERTHDHDYHNRQHIVHALYSHYFDKVTLTAGADYMNDYLSTYQFDGAGYHSQHSFDIYVQGDYHPLSWLNIVGSLREDYFSASSKSALTGRFAVMFKPEWLTIRASYSEGFRAPTLKEMYMVFDMAGLQMVYGNPDLMPERSHNINLSFERSGSVNRGWLSGAYNVTATTYYTIYDQRITTTDFPGDEDREAGAIYVNERGVKTFGVDISARYKMECGVGAKIGYNYLYTTGSTFDSQFSQPRPHSATWRLDYEHTFGSIYRTYAAISGRYMSAPDSELPTDSAYSLWRLTVEQRIWRGIDLTATIENLFNYRPKAYYWNTPPTTGINFAIGISLDLRALAGK